MNKINSVFFSIWHTFYFSFLIIVYSLYALIKLISRVIKPFNVVSNSLWFFLDKIDVKPKNSISNVEIISLCIHNLRTKKARTIITIGGMTIGISTIVFLVSLGFGVQQLVISRVARLDEMRQVDVSPQPNSKLKLDDKSLSDIKDITGVQSALPLISVVGKVSYNKSITDMAVYGVTSDYLKSSAIKPISGVIFDSNDISQINSEDSDNLSSSLPLKKYGDPAARVKVYIDNGQWLKIKKEPYSKAPILGYVTKLSDTDFGQAYWGEYVGEEELNTTAVDENGEKLSYWIKVRLPLYVKSGDTYKVQTDSAGQDKVVDGYIPQNEIKFDIVSQALADSQSLVPDITIDNIDTETLDLINYQDVDTSIKKIPVPNTNSFQAIVNRSALKLMGLSDQEALNQEITISFVTTNESSDGKNQRLETENSSYKIIGILPDETTPPIIYVPFLDLRSLGVNTFSQLKVIVDNQDNLAQIRKQIEVSGYNTHSVVDTVSQINNLFSTARLILAMLGIVALAVAALGMFNTLTVSLMERTREVGLMKAMGMKSSEIMSLFLAESLLMGSLGGIFGILAGFILGKILDIILSTFTIYKGVGTINISYIPISFILTIIGLSLFVGIFTGIFPAKRATKISALNALRYE